MKCVLPHLEASATRVLLGCWVLGCGIVRHRCGICRGSEGTSAAPWSLDAVPTSDCSVWAGFEGWRQSDLGLCRVDDGPSLSLRRVPPSPGALVSWTSRHTPVPPTARPSRMPEVHHSPRWGGRSTVRTAWALGHDGSGCTSPTQRGVSHDRLPSLAGEPSCCTARRCRRDGLRRLKPVA